jgi:CheY-like chemotaxis protein
VENALLNLAINARDAMRDGGRLTIECVNMSLQEAPLPEDPEAKAGDYVVLSVTDTGDGMPAEVIEHAFEPFFTTKDVGEGSGLGLSMVYGFAKQSGGFASINSAEGQGTTIRVYLPRTGEGPVKEIVEIRDEPAGAGELVLVVEDDPDLRAATGALLRTLGYRTAVAGDAAAARAVMDGDAKVDLILSDVVLPGGVSGPEYVEEARRKRPSLPVVFMSGHAADVSRRNGFLTSDDILLNKPFSRPELAQALAGALNRDKGGT